MMRYMVLGILVGFGVAVLALAAFGTGGGLVPLPAPEVDAGVPAPVPVVKVLEVPVRMVPVGQPGLRRPTTLMNHFLDGGR
jgi:hypothetical protein